MKVLLSILSLISIVTQVGASEIVTKTVLKCHDRSRLFDNHDTVLTISIDEESENRFVSTLSHRGQTLSYITNGFFTYIHEPTHLEGVGYHANRYTLVSTGVYGWTHFIGILEIEDNISGSFDELEVICIPEYS